MLKVETHEYPNVGLIDLRGSFVISEINNFDSKINNIKENYNKIGISFEKVSMVDSSGLGLLVQLYKHIMNKKDGELYIIEAKDSVKDIFEMSQLAKYFNMISKEEFRNLFIGHEYKMDFNVHTPDISDVNLEYPQSAKLSLKVIEKLLKENDNKYYFEEDTNIFKKGKEITEKDIQQLKSRGYETIWISSEKHLPQKDSKEEILRELRIELENALSDLYQIFDEKRIKTGSTSTISYFDGKDLLRSQLDPLQREGAQKLYHSMFGDHAKINQIRILLDKITQERIYEVNIFSSRGVGNFVENKTQVQMSRNMDEIKYNIINRSVNCVFMFIATCNRIFGERAKRGQQMSLQRLEKGEKRYDKNKRSQFQSDLINNAAYGILFHDFGFNHLKLRQLLIKELQNFKDNNGEYIKDSSKRLPEEERALLKRHVNITFNIMSADSDSMYASAIADNIIKFHHCFLDGNGYPGRKEFMEDNVVRYVIPIQELTRLFTIINTYESLIDRKPYRLPLRRESVVKYLLNNSVKNLDPMGKPDEVGIWDIDSTKKQPGLFDGFLVKEFFKTINVYKPGESVVLKNEKNGKNLAATILENNKSLPHRPLVRVHLKDKWGKIDLSDSQYDEWVVDELYETVVI